MAKHVSRGRLLEVEILKECKRLWREAHFEVKMYKTPQGRREVEMSKKCTLLWREARLKVNMLKTFGGSDHFLTIRLPFDVEEVHGAVAPSTFPSQKC